MGSAIMTTKIRIPKDFPVRPLKPGETAKDKATCGTCGLSWDDSIVTSMTPAPSSRCPFEYFHVEQVTTPTPPKHTPTPWTTQHNDPLVIIRKSDCDDKSYRFIALVDSRHDGTRQVSEVDIENVALILRAVNSHEALLKLAKHIGRQGTHIDSAKCLHCEAQAAISQAEGAI